MRPWTRQSQLTRMWLQCCRLIDEHKYVGSGCQIGKNVLRLPIFKLVSIYVSIHLYLSLPAADMAGG